MAWYPAGCSWKFINPGIKTRAMASSLHNRAFWPKQNLGRCLRGALSPSAGGIIMKSQWNCYESRRNWFSELVVKKIGNQIVQNKDLFSNKSRVQISVYSFSSYENQIVKNKDTFSQINLGFKFMFILFQALKIRLSRTKTPSLNYCCWLICSPSSDIVSPLLIVMIVPVSEKQWKILRHNGLSCTCRGICNDCAQHCDLIIVHILILVHILIIVCTFSELAILKQWQLSPRHLLLRVQPTWDQTSAIYSSQD